MIKSEDSRIKTAILFYIEMVILGFYMLVPVFQHNYISYCFLLYCDIITILYKFQRECILNDAFSFWFNGKSGRLFHIFVL